MIFNKPYTSEEFIKFCDGLIIPKYLIALETDAYRAGFNDYDDIAEKLLKIEFTQTELEEHVMKSHGTKEKALNSHKNREEYISWFHKDDVDYVRYLVNTALHNSKKSLSRKIGNYQNRPYAIYDFDSPIGYCINEKGNVVETTSLKLILHAEKRNPSKQERDIYDKAVSFKLISAYPIL